MRQEPYGDCCWLYALKMTTNRKEDDSQLVANELLMYVFHHMKRHPSDSIKSVLLDFSSAEAISDAKRKLWECYSSSLRTFERRTNKGLKNANRKEVDDIMRSVKTLDGIFADTALPYVCVAVNMDQVPDVRPGKTETFSLRDGVNRLVITYKIKYKVTCLWLQLNQMKLLNTLIH